MKPLHKGKLSAEVKISLPEGMDQHIKEVANQSQTFVSAIILDAIFFAVTGKTYSEHIANDRRSLFQIEVRDSCVSSPTNGGDKGE